jgi:hypothetical protein
MSPQTFNLILLLILAALYLLVLATLIQRRAGQETAASLFSGHVVIGLVITVGEALWRGGRWRLATQVANDFQVYGVGARAHTAHFDHRIYSARYASARSRCILDSGSIIIVPNLLVWAKWFG